MANLSGVYPVRPTVWGAYNYNGAFIYDSETNPGSRIGAYNGDEAYTSLGSNGSGGLLSDSQVAFAVFNAPAIEAMVQQLVAAGDSVHVSLSYTVVGRPSGDSSYATEPVKLGYYTSLGYQNSVASATTNPAGPGPGQPAYNFSDLLGAGEVILSEKDYTVPLDTSTGFFSVYPYTQIPDTIDVSGQIDQAAVAGRYLVLTVGQGVNSTYSYAINPTIKITFAEQGPVPTITGTQGGQTLASGQSSTPFSHATLTDPGNPGGAGDEIQVSVLHVTSDGSAGTDDYGTLGGVGLTAYGDGAYTLTADSLADLQSELQSLVFTSRPFTGTTHANLSFELDFQSVTGRVADDQSTTLDISPACFCRGTLILTDKGEVPVEELAIGQVAVTAAGIHRLIRWIGRRSYAGRFLRANPRCQPIRFRAGSLGDGLPRRDLLVSQEHAMLLDGVLVPAALLVNGTTVARERAEQVEYLHVELDSHDILLAEGAPSESYVDDNSRGMFHNRAEFDALYADVSGYADGSGPAVFCAPRVTHGDRLEAIRRKMANPVGNAA